MKPRLLLALALAVLVEPFTAGAPAGSTSTSPWQNFDLRDLEGHTLPLPGRWLVVVFLGQECPVSNQALPTLNALAAEFAQQGVTIVGAFVDGTADLPSLRQHVADYRIAFPVVDDRAQRFAHRAGARLTPEAVVYNAAGVKVYSGRVDDRVGTLGAARPAAAHQDLRDVLLALTSGQPGPFPEKLGDGCALPERVGS